MKDTTKFLELSKKFEQLKNELNQVKEQLNAELQTIGVGEYFQDPSSMAVYHVVVPKGQFVTYSTIGYERTALEGEARGTLSRKEAQEKGFTLK